MTCVLFAKYSSLRSYKVLNIIFNGQILALLEHTYINLMTRREHSQKLFFQLIMYNLYFTKSILLVGLIHNEYFHFVIINGCLGVG